MSQRTPRIFVEQTIASGNILALNPDNSRYLCKVLRKREGDTVTLFNGDGFNYPAAIRSIGKAVQIETVGKIENPTESPLKITLVQGLAKGAKLDLVVQKATELGVTRIVPVANDRSVLQLAEDKVARKHEHWRKIAISACAQCNRSVIPIIHKPLSFANWLAQSIHHNAVLLDPSSHHTLQSIPISSASCTLVVGPEGGFSAIEITQAMDQGIQPIRCGPRILRTETAGFAAIAVLQARVGDLC